MMELWLAIRQASTNIECTANDEISKRLILMVLGYRIPSSVIADYPIHKAIKEGKFQELVSIEDEST